MVKVMVIDESTAMRRLLSLALRQKGFSVTECFDSAHALTTSENEDHDLIIANKNMANMNGLEFSKTLRSQDNYQSTPIVMLTTNPNDEKEEQGKLAGVTEWLVKPFDPDHLFRTIDRVLA